jgi:hypothetical protein
MKNVLSARNNPPATALVDDSSIYELFSFVKFMRNQTALYGWKSLFRF